MFGKLLAHLIKISILTLACKSLTTCGEMDITTVFGTVIPGSSPGGWTQIINYTCLSMCFFFSLYLRLERWT